MLRSIESATRLCDGLTRRDWLQIGQVAGMGICLDNWFGAAQVQAAPVTTATGFGKAKACILVFLTGSPPQHETFDPKPAAPAEVQGEMKAIATNVAGLNICERLPRHARIMDRLTVVRSMTHPYPLHGVGYATSAMPLTNPELNSLPRDPRQRPFIGSVVDYFTRRDRQQSASQIPSNIGLPWLFGIKSEKYGSGTKRMSGPY